MQPKVLKRVVCFIFLYPLYCLPLAGLPESTLAEVDSIAYSAKELKSDSVNGKACKKLEGAVVFTFHPSGMELRADKAYKYEDENKIQAQGNVKIVDKEGSIVRADRLTYYPEKKLAILEKNVIIKSKKATFYTQKLVYNIEKKQGQFFNGGKLLQDQVVLTSSTGSYDGAAHTVTFSKEVVLVDPSCTLHCNHLSYNTETEMAYFQGFTKIIHEDGSLTTQKGGSYLVPKKHLIFNQGTLATKDMGLTADCLEVFEAQDCAAAGHVSLQSKAHDAVIVGEQARYFKKEKKAEITGHPLLTKVVNNEMMYLRADTFISLEKSEKEGASTQEIHALNNVRLYQENLQGVADGAIYNSNEGIIHLHNKPIIWCDSYQITGEEVSLVIEEEEQIKMVVNKNLFMASANPVGNYNQVKGHQMVASFKNGVMQKMSITGNGESLYFALGDKNELVGMNHIKCNDMEMIMSGNELERMEFKPKPIGVFYPAAKLESEQMELSDFIWHGDKWPTKESVLATPAPA